MNIRFVVYRINDINWNDRSVEDIREFPMYTKSGNIRQEAIAKEIGFLADLYGDNDSYCIEIDYINTEA